jgi:phage tail sheath gpL-like
VLFLPQRVAVLAQGSIDAGGYSTNKFTPTTAAEVGRKLGYGSPAHLAMLQLQPLNGDGLGTVPVTIYPLAQPSGGGAAPSVGAITPVGTQTKAAQYRVRVGNVSSAPFALPAGATVSHTVGALMAAIQGVLEMPVTVAATYGAIGAGAGANVGNGTIGTLSISGAPRPGAYKLTLTQVVANGGVFRLQDPDGTVIATDVAMTPAPGGATVITRAGMTFTLTDGATDFAVGDSFTITVAATALTLTSKWRGASANAIKIEVEGDSYGITFGITQPVGGLVNPDVAPALAQMGSTWETLVVNTLNIEDTAALDAISTAGEGRWGELLRKPFVSFVGVTSAEVADATAITNARPTDRVNAAIPSPGSKDLPFVVAARAVARIATLANNNPPTDYGSQRLTGLKPGPDASQWTFLQRDQAIKAGCSTVEVRDGVVCLSDVVTMYRPTGEEPPGYRYVVDIVKLQNLIFNLSLIFERPEWDGAPLLPDNQPSINERARKPRTAVAAVNAMLDYAGLYALISDSAAAKKKTRATINAQNPKRLDINVEVQLSGNVNIKALSLSFGFYFGALTPV